MFYSVSSNHIEMLIFSENSILLKSLHIKNIFQLDHNQKKIIFVRTVHLLISFYLNQNDKNLIRKPEFFRSINLFFAN